MIRSRYFQILGILFILTLPLSNPWVRGDGVNYYAYARAMLVQHNLNFEDDWRHANLSFRTLSVSPQGQIAPDFYTSTGHVRNNYAVGSAILWAPFLVPVHACMLLLRRMGFDVAADGFSKPYLLAMAWATAFYGFMGLCLSFRMASFYVGERWAFLATLGIWFASALPVYMYFIPCYSHALSVFVVALFLWYWLKTRDSRSLAAWLALGLLSGLMLDVYYLNIAILVLPLGESLWGYWNNWRAPGHAWAEMRGLFAKNLAYCLATATAFLPTLITRQIINGHPLELGYDPLGLSHWIHPALWQPLFSSNHGLVTWTPIVIPALVGLILLRNRDRGLAALSVAAVDAFYYIVACHSDWHGVSSFSNRFFISLTPFFILGLGVALREAARWFKQPRAALATAAAALGALILWNAAFIFQWGVGLIPHRGPIAWGQMAYNQVFVVPARLGGALKSYFTNRGAMMQRIETEDVKRLGID